MCTAVVSIGTSVVVFGALLVSACGGIAVIDGHGAGGASSSTTSGSTTSSSTTSNSASSNGGDGGSSWQPPVSPCVSCAAWIQSCEPDATLCPHPDSGCEGESLNHIEALVKCVCDGCQHVCNGSCVMFDEAMGYVCWECQTYVLELACGYEYGNCLMDE